MKATLIYLAPEQHRAVKARARAEGLSVTELMRRLVDAHVTVPAAAVPPAAYRALVGLGASRGRDIGDQHDRYVASALRSKHAR